MRITSPEFEDGEKLPEKHGYPRENTSPELEIEGVPEKAESLVVIADDPDAVEPAGKIWVHWTMWNIPADADRIAEDEAPGIEGTTDFRKTGYNGPNPPDGEHTYYFRLYALDTELDLEEGASREELDEAMEGHIIEEAELTARCGRLS
ncbi:YbhB/YbcL family Raf kinase inhibitor-like protein [Candidatus Nanohalobium constans]|uniref:Phosphatidylethanolamine-binding protein (PEBP) family n=1 Tax=Candidatus Nanohalobium constans TaxID=2565781 RepID=A0A5Q0UGW5_9ARCH|nr:YbhB/YbcL family Raf kinase inhibitor-like protein [Candidatus Nanohalobium constans]QGA80611.1 phosphatidylethanolamine-binding protein (PEBP) family [Candidatus Nanohalobium constans]